MRSVSDSSSTTTSTATTRSTAITEIDQEEQSHKTEAEGNLTQEEDSDVLVEPGMLLALFELKKWVSALYVGITEEFDDKSQWTIDAPICEDRIVRTLDCWTWARGVFDCSGVVDGRPTKAIMKIYLQ